MREAFSGTALFMIVVFFIALFTGYLCLSINQSKAFAVKNAIIRVIERNGVGLKDADSLVRTNFPGEITSELREAGYRTEGTCDGEWVGFNSHGENIQPYVFCVLYKDSGGGSVSNPNSQLHYYKVKTFYHFDLPVIRYMFDLTIEGTTKPMM